VVLSCDGRVDGPLDVHAVNTDKPTTAGSTRDHDIIKPSRSGTPVRRHMGRL
jgi:hypothetical protein